MVADAFLLFAYERAILMNTELAYLIGMILGNGEIQRGPVETTVIIDIPYKNIRTDDDRDVQVYVKASLIDIRSIIEPVLGNDRLVITSGKNATKVSFTTANTGYMQEVNQYIGNGTRQQNMKMTDQVFTLSTDYKKSLLRGIADVTAYIRKSNEAFGEKNAHRVYIEIPKNWQMVIDIANLLKFIDIPVQTIDFAHPNFRDSKRKKYNAGNVDFWKKEHQIKIWATEFLPIGFNIQHKQEALEKYAKLLTDIKNRETTHKFYWEKPIRRRVRPIHPGESDEFIPARVRGKHYESWADLAKDLGYYA